MYASTSCHLQRRLLAFLTALRRLVSPLPPSVCHMCHRPGCVLKLTASFSPLLYTGRLNVLANVVRKPMAQIFSEFAGKGPRKGQDVSRVTTRHESGAVECARGREAASEQGAARGPGRERAGKHAVVTLAA